MDPTTTPDIERELTPEERLSFEAAFDHSDEVYSQGLRAVQARCRTIIQRASQRFLAGKGLQDTHYVYCDDKRRLHLCRLPDESKDESEESKDESDD